MANASVWSIWSGRRVTCATLSLATTCCGHAWINDCRAANCSFVGWGRSELPMPCPIRSWCSIC
ncbi:hypothetical protein PF001_g11946 [Phytophthora fragariae]|uniref:Secreted protein n=1 Tax=Phytophthora fragariae TaxID=53985 RepID=A0A6A4DE40_9STRA|nr:hypothetical protein PF009_g13794 [Phytophthora fragariae]KAE9129923.1 hypothetical protein PF006_g15877 [Phytophthora fragariae]KAE9306780.1 hypothetical protein PF001_g11946 [Phytophthora fragariae]KAE9354102.1 hypothetical protein PF008_g4675 [Phytophthora fragariae]